MTLSDKGDVLLLDDVPGVERSTLHLDNGGCTHVFPSFYGVVTDGVTVHIPL